MSAAAQPQQPLALGAALASGDVRHGAFMVGDRVVQLAAARAAAFPHVPQRVGAGAAAPAFDGTPDELLASVDAAQRPGVAAALQRQAKNKVKKCAACGKPVAFTMATCNGCGASLADVPVTHTNNVFMGFVYGVARGPFPFTVSLRAQTERLLVFDDLLALTPLHINVVPTALYVPDVRHLFAQPARGAALVDAMFDACWRVVVEQFAADAAFVAKTLRLDVGGGAGGGAGDAAAVAAALRPHVQAGFNYPPSQYQLHLQFMLPPFTPAHYALYLRGVHFTPGRFVPYEYVRDALALGDAQRFAALADDTPIADVFAHYKAAGIDYERYHTAAYARAGESHRALANWNAADFDAVVVDVDGAVHAPLHEHGQVSAAPPLDAAADAKALVAADKLALQNYGRPYDAASGKTSGQYYKFAKRPGDVDEW